MEIKGDINTDQIKKDFEEFLRQKYGQSETARDVPGGSAGPKKNETEDGMHFDLKPEELETYLNRFVVGQPEAVEIIATKIATHYNRMKLEDTLTDEQKVVGNIKSNVLLIGPTGVGKTYIVKLVAKKIGVPFVKGDATKFSETGYVGGDVEDLIRDLVKEADGDIKKAEYGIVYLDEIDKIASSKNVRGGLDVSRSGVQRNLLKLMEESEVDLKVPHDMASQLEAVMEMQKNGKSNRKKVNTKNILFVMSGAFAGLDDIVRKRISIDKIGFNTGMLVPEKVRKAGLLKHVMTEDLVEYGFETEFVGRLPVVAVLNELSVDGLFEILKNPDSSVIMSKKRDFQSYGIDILFDDSSLRIIAQRANLQGTGARGLVNIIENILIKFEKKLPSTSIRQFLVTREVVENPGPELETLLKENAVKEFRDYFRKTYEVSIDFAPEAVNKILESAENENTTFFHIAARLFKDLQYGLKLIGENTLFVDEEMMRDPQKYLDNIIKGHYEPGARDARG
jgi:ATP-dependent Clp protease ATP-binding subunit ClpX